jgi:hypothetical protein
VLDADPLAQISNIRKLRWVIANGRVLDPAKLWAAAGFQMTLTRRSFLTALFVCSIAACREAAPLSAERAILILISIDGFRADYLDRLRPPTLSKLAAAGVQADGLIRNSRRRPSRTTTPS